MIKKCRWACLDNVTENFERDAVAAVEVPIAFGEYLLPRKNDAEIDLREIFYIFRVRQRPA